MKVTTPLLFVLALQIAATRESSAQSRFDSFDVSISTTVGYGPISFDAHYAVDRTVYYVIPSIGIPAVPESDVVQSSIVPEPEPTISFHGISSQRAIYVGERPVFQEFSQLHQRSLLENTELSFETGSNPVEVDRMRLREIASADRLPRVRVDSFDAPVAVPEPGVLALGTVGALSLCLSRFRRRLQ